jgi:hypothetical protein
MRRKLLPPLAVWVTLAISAVSLGIAVPAFAKKANPRASAAPNSNLTNGQEVTVSGTGYVPNSEVFVVECNKGIKAKGAGAAFCDTSHIVAVMVTSGGAVPPTSFKVRTGTIGNKTCGTSKKDSQCYIGVGDAKGDSNDSALAKIKFVP